MWGSNPLFLREKLWVLSSLLIVGHCARDGVYGVPASPTCFNVVFSLFARCVVVIQPAFRFFKEEIVPYVAVDSVCPWEEVSSGSSYVTILNWNSKLNIFEILSS